MKWLTLIPAALILSACTSHEILPPALPDEPIIITEFIAPVDMAPVEIKDCPVNDVVYGKKPRLQNRTPFRGSISSSSPLNTSDIPNTNTVSLLERDLPTKSRNTLPPEQLVEKANTDARIVPDGSGYAGRKAIYTFRFESGKVYTIPMNPSTTTRFYFPGEKIVSGPTFMTKGEEPEWFFSTPEKVGGDMHPTDLLLLRPLMPGLTQDTAVDLASGKTIFLHLVPAKVAMLGVTWEFNTEGRENLGQANENKPSKVQEVSKHVLEEKVPPCNSMEAKNGYSMPIELAQLHTGYTLEVKGGAGFIPIQVYDDGRKTLIKLKQLSGNAPAVFTTTSSGTRTNVNFSVYKVPGDGTKNFYLVVEGVWNTLELAGTDGQSVIITRLHEGMLVAHPVRTP